MFSIPTVLSPKGPVLSPVVPRPLKTILSPMKFTLSPKVLGREIPRKCFFSSFWSLCLEEIVKV